MLLRKVLICACMVSAWGCATSDHSNVENLSGAGATRQQLDLAAEEIIKKFDGEIDDVIDGALINAVIIAFDYVKSIAPEDDEVRDITSRLVAIDETASSVRVIFFSKLYSEVEILHEKPPAGYVCKSGISCYRFGSGGVYEIEVDKVSDEIIRAELLFRY